MLMYIVNFDEKLNLYKTYYVFIIVNENAL